ncbi:MAG: tetratricopeptide repeat protein [Gammaproteobacteria bacterium]|nr:tetratricopeptide repeat protein [Gammaproteobacteria bacterium]
MNIYVSDKEQIEMIKTWWRENGRFTILSVAAALIISAGWRFWQNNKLQDSANASVIYEQMLNQESHQDISAAEYEVTNLLTNHPRTPYASLASFVSAQNAINANNLEGASEKFDWIIANSKNADFKQIAKIRKARLMIAMQKYDEGLQLLNNPSSETYLPLINEVKGDLLAAKGDIKGALGAYQNALNSLRKDASNREFLLMKYNHLKSTS